MEISVGITVRTQSDSKKVGLCFNSGSKNIVILYIVSST